MTQCNKEFNKKVILTWSFSTWKSTLIKRLQDLWFPVINEGCRQVLTKLWISSNELTWEIQETFQKEIVELQISEERNKPSFITDTSLLENLAYSSHLRSFSELEETIKWELKEYDYIFLCPLLSEIEDDWVRYVDREYQREIEKRIKKLYEKYNYTIIEIPIIWDTVEEQIENKLKYILQVLK